MTEPTSPPAPEWLDLENKRVEARRAILNATGQSSGTPAKSPHRLTGLALSGGGIRSATVSLGMLQALARADVLRHFDYLSTVSGGGYTGSFFCSLLMPKEVRQSQTDTPSDDQLRTALDAGLAKLGAVEQRTEIKAYSAATPISWLRSSGRYLAPNGGGDVWFAFTLWLRNLLAVHYVIGLTLVCLLAFAGLLNHAVSSTMTDCFAFCDANQSLAPSPHLLPGMLYGVLAFVTLVVAVLPLGVAYWYTEMPKITARGWWAGITTKTTLCGLLMGPTLLAVGHFGGLKVWQSTIVIFLSLILVAASLWYLTAWTRTWTKDKPGRPAAWMQVTRTRLTRYLSHALVVCVGCLALGVVLIVCNWMVGWVASHPWRGISGASVLAALLAVWKLIPAKADASKKSLAVQWLPLLGAMVLGTLLVTGWGTVAAWLLECTLDDVKWFAVIAMVLLMLALITGETFQFLNLSTIQNLYTARIIRAYLGATNGARGTAREGQDMTEPHTHDDLALSQYYGSVKGCGSVNDVKVQLSTLAPLHLINVTINQAIAPQGSLVDQDRKGLPLAVTPDGYLVDGEFHRRLSVQKPGGAAGSNSPKPPVYESMPLGRWIGISGAAFGPGLGRQTRPELSLLMVLANVRLGYWWKVKSGSPKMGWQPFSTQRHLYRESRGSFRGTNDSHWYLSDGGHFENTGVYELLRRRVGFILALDNGADPDYQFEDMANLIRLASVDLGAEFKPIEIAVLKEKLKGLPESPLIAKMGDLEAFASDMNDDTSALLAYEVTLPKSKDFPEEHTAILLSVKPRMTAQASLDLQQYKATHSSFPQEATADQFFDDQQWESYRKLGQFAGDLLFANPTPH